MLSRPGSSLATSAVCKLPASHLQAHNPIGQEIFVLPWNYSCSSICHLCKATQGGPMAYTNFSDTAPHRLGEAARSNNDYLAEVQSKSGFIPPFADVAGFDVTRTVLEDVMHIVALGIAQWAAGNVMVELLVDNVFGEYGGRGAWKDRAHALHSDNPYACGRCAVIGRRLA